MADGKADNPIVTPLFRFIQQEWPEIEQKIKTVQVQEEDFLLYVLWTLDSVKEREKDFASQMWSLTYSALRKHFIIKKYTSPGNDLEYLTNNICAFTLYSIGLLITEDNRNIAIYGEIAHNLEEHWPEVRAIKHKISAHPATPGIKEWLYAYMNNDIFYTVSDKIDWDKGIGCELPSLTMPAPAVTNIGQLNITNFNNHPGASFIDNSTNAIQADLNQNLKDY